MPWHQTETQLACGNAGPLFMVKHWLHRYGMAANTIKLLQTDNKLRPVRIAFRRNVRDMVKHFRSMSEML